MEALLDSDELRVPPGFDLKVLPLVEEPAEIPLVLMAWAVAVVAVLLPCALAYLFGPPLPRRAGFLGGKLLAGSGGSDGDGTPLGVALVVAHPDDEAMFFWPTLLQLRDAGVALSVLCLSTGNADGLGELRKEEMRRSCARLGIEGHDLVVLDVDKLQDGSHAWSEEEVALRVTEFVRARGARLVLTFDDYGISGHPNHISTSLGVRRACDGCLADLNYRGFNVLMLESVGLPTKYVGALNLFLVADADSSPTVTFCACARPLTCLRALAVHWSQLVWYRVLFAVFSRYSYLNTYARYVPTVAHANSDAEPSPPAPGAVSAESPSGARRRR